MNITGRKKEFLITVISNLLLQVTTAVCGFILPPLIVTTFGSSINGMVSSITQFIAYLNIVEAGIGAASIAALYKPLAQNDIAGQNGILSATKHFYNKSGLLFTVLVIGLSLIYPLIVKGQVDTLTASLMVLILGISGAAEFFLIGKYRVLLTADKKVYVISLIQVLAVIANTVFAVVLINNNAGILIVKLLSGLLYLGRYTFIWLYVKRNYTYLDLTVPPDRKAISQSKNALVHQISALVVFNTPIVLITFFCSLKDASVYAVYAMVFSAVGNLVGAFTNGMEAFFGESLVKDSIEHTGKIFSRYTRLYIAVLGWVYSCTFLLIVPFMRLYTRNMTDAEYIQPLLAILFLISEILKNIRNPCNQLICGAGHFKKTQNRSITEAVLNLCFSLIFVLKFGVIGVLMGSIASHLYRTTDMIIYSYRHILKQSMWNFLISVFVYLLVCIFMISLIRFFTVNVASYMSWFFYALICGLVLSIPLLLPIIFQFKKTYK
ncbi:MAG: polysaccharide transport protein [Spirochaetia bacterium]|nr:polysaccharide transport protein [Spirochaetia bacterium]